MTPSKLPLAFGGPLTILDTFAFLLGLTALSFILATYGTLLPFARKGYDLQGPSIAFSRFFLVLAESEIIAIFGLILGILSWMLTHAVNWVLFWPFFAAGEGHMIYIYVRKFPPAYHLMSHALSDAPVDGPRETRKNLQHLATILLLIIIVPLFWNFSIISPNGGKIILIALPFIVILFAIVIIAVLIGAHRRRARVPENPQQQP